MDKRIINKGMKVLAKSDEDIARALEQLGPPPPRLRPAGFETLLNTIVSQQISTEAARAIMGRVCSLVPEISASALLTVGVEELRRAGLSYRKIEYALQLAQAIDEGRFDVAGLAECSNEDAITSITALRGFGRWSAEIYLLFSLRRCDIFPADDLALQTALARLKGLSSKPTPKQARALVAHWAPWRSVGALFLWHYYSGAPTT